jgi:hypothetical protein
VSEFARGRLRRTGEVIGDGVQGVRFGFRKSAAQLLLDAIDDMEEQASVHTQLAAAQPPVGSEYEMIAEYPLLKFIEYPPADDTEVGQEFLSLPRVAPPALTAGAEVQRYGSHVRYHRAFAEAVVTGSKNGSKYALTGHFLASAYDPNSVPVAMGARCFCQAKRV